MNRREALAALGAGVAAAACPALAKMPGWSMVTDLKLGAWPDAFTTDLRMETQISTSSEILGNEEDVNLIRMWSAGRLVWSTHANEQDLIRKNNIAIMEEIAAGKYGQPRLLCADQEGSVHIENTQL